MIVVDDTTRSARRVSRAHPTTVVLLRSVDTTAWLGNIGIFRYGAAR